MIACNIPCNLNRAEFAFERWADWDKDLFLLIRDSLLKKTREFHYTIQGYDLESSAIRKAQENIENANLEEYINVSQKDFFETEKKVEGPLHIVFNPPYDERISIETEDFYEDIGNVLKQHYAGTKAWFITANLEGLKYVGLRPSVKIKLMNGNLEARLVKYEMYAGSKKQSGKI
jgi:putative N6-adenine-specific DNA methylase